MIARTWHGRVPATRADAYQAYLERTGLKDYRAIPGNRGVIVLRRTEGADTHFVLTTLWESVRRSSNSRATMSARALPEDDDPSSVSRSSPIRRWLAPGVEGVNVPTPSNRESIAERLQGRDNHVTGGIDSVVERAVGARAASFREIPSDDGRFLVIWSHNSVLRGSRVLLVSR